MEEIDGNKIDQSIDEELKEDKQQIIRSKPDMGFVYMQIEQAMETYRTQFHLLTSSLTILVIANVTVFGYAMTIKTAGIIMVGTIFPIMIYYIIYRVNKLMIPIIYTAIRLEQEFGGEGIDWLATTFIGATGSTNSLQSLIQLNEQSSQEKRIELLRNSKVMAMGTGKGFARLALIFIVVGQLVLPFILTIYFGWNFF